MQQENNKPQNPGDGRQPKQRDLSRYETSLGKVLQTLAIVASGGIVLVAFLKYVVGLKF